MPKDPAFLFYSSDFLTGVQDLTMEERGQYITLLCLHHQKGRLNAKMIQLACHGNATADVLAKFRQDEHGLYYHPRLEEEAEKRRAHGEKQREKAAKRWNKCQTDTTAHATASAMAMPLENENEDESINEKKGVQGETSLNRSNLFRKPQVPTFEDVHRVFIQNGGTKEQAEAFYNKHTGTGWFLNNSPIVNYSSLIPSFIRNWKTNHNATTKINGKSTGAAKLAASLAADLQQRNG